MYLCFYHCRCTAKYSVCRCSLPCRYQTSLLASLGFLISFGVRCNMGVAMIQMVKYENVTTIVDNITITTEAVRKFSQAVIRIDIRMLCQSAYTMNSPHSRTGIIWLAKFTPLHCTLRVGVRIINTMMCYYPYLGKFAQYFLFYSCSWPSYLTNLLSLRLAGAVGARITVGSPRSLGASSVNRTWAQHRSILTQAL